MSTNKSTDNQDNIKDLLKKLEDAKETIIAINQKLSSLGLETEDVDAVLSAANSTPKESEAAIEYETQLPDFNKNSDIRDTKDFVPSIKETDEGKIIEGIFDGQNMTGPASKVYPVPANYASKSQLVEGDILKLTIMNDGSFIYKQIGPMPRRKAIGKLILEDSQYKVIVGDKSYKVLFASVTYFKGKAGDEFTIVLPKDREASWAAVEAIIS
jgi:hypothetical protein